ncbi:hypothetical protein ACLB2K_051008 [Fragaria x ananassa]
MVAKYKKCWDVVPYTFCFGAIMDLRIKLNGLELILSEIGKNLEITIPMTSTNIQNNFNDTYNLYAKKYAAASVQISQTSHHPSPLDSNASSSQAVFGLLASKTKQKGVVSSCNGFFKYLDADFTEFMTEEEKVKLDILGWWKTHSRNFPVLSIMARDLLTTLVSTVASESAFSAGGRVLDEKRSRLTPGNLEALMMKKTKAHLPFLLINKSKTKLRWQRTMRVALMLHHQCDMDIFIDEKGCVQVVRQTGLPPFWFMRRVLRELVALLEMGDYDSQISVSYDNWIWRMN